MAKKDEEQTKLKLDDAPDEQAPEEAVAEVAEAVEEPAVEEPAVETAAVEVSMEEANQSPAPTATEYPDMNPEDAPPPADPVPHDDGTPAFNGLKPYSMIWHNGTKQAYQNGIIYNRVTKEPIG